MNIKGKWASSDNIKNKVKMILKSDIVCNNDLNCENQSYFFKISF